MKANKILDFKTNIKESITKEKEKNPYLHLISEWCQTSTSHGLPNIFRNKNRILKVLWTIFTLSSWGYCFYLIILSLVSYFGFDVISSFKIINEAPTRFPVISICNLNPYDGLKLDDFLLAVMDGQINFVNDTSAHKNEKIKADQFLNKLLNLLEKNSSNGDFNLTDYGYDLSKMLINCRYQGKECSSTDFYRYHNFYYGNCYKFNSGKTSNESLILIKNSTKPGWRYGLQLELDVGDTEKSLKLSYKSGFRIVIHNQSVDAFPEEEGISVGTGTETNIAISRLILSRMSSPYSNCKSKISKYDLDNNEFLEKMLNEYNMNDYNQKFCSKLCLQKYIINNCNCFDLSLPKMKKNQTLNGCSEEQDLVCRENAESEFFNTNAINDCYDKCPVECEVTIYNTDISVSNFPTKWFLETFFDPQSDNAYDDLAQQYNERKLLVNIYYNDMTYTSIIENASITSDALLGTIGGLLGLFIGISVLSVMENFEILFLLIELALKKNKNKP